MFFSVANLKWRRLVGEIYVKFSSEIETLFENKKKSEINFFLCVSPPPLAQSALLCVWRDFILQSNRVAMLLFHFCV